MTIENVEHTYTVELRVYGRHLDPDLITRETGLSPCQVRRAGDPKSATRKYVESVWAFNGGLDAPNEWSSLEAGLMFVLERVIHLAPLFGRYRASYGVVWWCGHFQSGFDGGPELSASLLEKLASFGCDLFIDNYFSEPSAT